MTDYQQPLISPVEWSGLAVSRTTYDAVQDRLSLIRHEDADYLSCLQRIAFCVIGSVSNRVATSRDSIAPIIGVHKSKMYGPLSLTCLISALTSSIFQGANVEAYEIRSKTSTVLSDIDSTPAWNEIQLIQKDVRRRFSDLDDPVYLFSGNSVGDYGLRELQKARNAAVQLTDSPIIRRLQVYLNGHTKQSMGICDERFEDARKHIINEYAADLQPAVFAHLQSIEITPAPRYTTTPTSPRLHSVGNSLQNVPRPIRRLLGADWIELDLSAASLTTAISVYGLEGDAPATWREQGIWKSMYDATVRTVTFDVFKTVAKDFCTPLLYGRSFGYARQELRKTYLRECGSEIPPPLYHWFKENILFSRLAAKTAQRIKDYESGRVIRDTLGGHVSPGLGGKTVQHIRIAAREFVLLEPVIDEAIRIRESTQTWKIVLWQHDGFSIHVKSKDPARRASIVRGLQTLVKVRGEEIGIPVSLKVDSFPNQK